MINKILVILCTFCLLIPTSVSAEGNLKLVTELTKGNKAPFTGILLSKESAAKLFAEIKFSKKECDLTTAEKVEIEKIKLNAQIDGLKIRLDTESDRLEKILSIKDERISFLEKNYRPLPWYEQGEFWLGVGVITGIAITVASAYAIGQAK